MQYKQSHRLAQLRIPNPALHSGDFTDEDSIPLGTDDAIQHRGMRYGTLGNHPFHIGDGLIGQPRIMQGYPHGVAGDGVDVAVAIQLPFVNSHDVVGVHSFTPLYCATASAHPL